MSDKTSDKRLKKCPFCGGEIKQMFMNEESFQECVWDESVGNVSTWFKCYECDSEFFHDEPIDTPEKQAEWWNTRKPVDDVVEALEELKEMHLTLWRSTDDAKQKQFAGLYIKAIEIVKEHLT